MKVLQIVGYKNSGKTTISREIITYFSSRGIKVGSLKNHGHGGPPVGIENTDSEQHRKAGATISGVLGENIFQLSHCDEWKITDMLVIYEQLKIDFLLIEGFKKLTFPKLVLLRNQEDSSLLASLDNVIGVIRTASVGTEDFDYPIFDLKNSEGIAEWIYHYLWGAK